MAAVGQLPVEAQWAIKVLKTDDGGAHLANAIRQGTAIAVSDGSLKLDIGTSAFILTSSTDDHCVVGANQVPGKVKDGDSHRCELAGIFAVLVLVEVLVRVFEITQGSVHLACDNKSALKVFHPDFLPDPQSANFDLVNACWKKIQSSPLRWTCEHVKGHQDKHRHRLLTRLEQLNVLMDKTAKALWSHVVRNHHLMPDASMIPFQDKGWQVGWLVGAVSSGTKGGLGELWGLSRPTLSPPVPRNSVTTH
jgi:hypothetical protein